MDVADNSKYLVFASYLEIYNEEVRDLLGKDVKAKLDLKEHPDKGVYVPSLSAHRITRIIVSIVYKPINSVDYFLSENFFVHIAPSENRSSRIT